MNANPETGGSILGILRGLIRREMASRAAQEVNRQRLESEEEKSDRKDAERIEKELGRVSESHPAREILTGTQFTRDALIKNENLRNFLRGILLIPDKTAAHDLKWLQDKLADSYQLIEDLTPMSQDYGALNKIQSNIEKLLNTADENKRIYEAKREAKGRKKEDTTEEERLLREFEEAENMTAAEAVERLVGAERLKFLAKKVLEDKYEEQIEETGEGGRRGRQNILDELVEAYEAEKLKLYNQLKNPEPGEDQEDITRMERQRQTNQKILEDLQKLDRAFRKVADHYVEKHPRTGERLYYAHGERDWRLQEERILNDPDYRDYIFYSILDNILYNKGTQPTGHLFQLYEHGDMHAFLSMVRKVRSRQDEPIGLRLAARYEILQNTIMQSHDMNFFCAHPQQDIKEFIGSTSQFLNSYIDAAVQDPLVSMAKRFYERALFQIREDCDGYIPREFLQWSEGEMRASRLDEIVEKHLRNAIKSGLLYRTKVDKVTQLPAPSVWNRLEIDKKNPVSWEEFHPEGPEAPEFKKKLGEYKIASALKQAKGLALVDQRLLEIIGKSKGTGTTYISPATGEKFAASAFNSIPYEGIVRYLEPMIHYYGRYNLGLSYHDAFFNIMIAEKLGGDREHAKAGGWDAKKMKKVVELHLEGDHEALKKYCEEEHMGDVATRLMEADNPFMYSGMWGTMTKWRIADASAGFDDWEKDKVYAGAVKLTTIGDSFSASERKSAFQKGDWTWAHKQVKRYYTEILNYENYKKYRSEFRDALLKSSDLNDRQMAAYDVAASSRKLPDGIRDAFDDKFERKWRDIGIHQKKNGSSKTYRQLLDEAWKEFKDKKNVTGIKAGSDAAILIQQLERAYKARTWVQMAMRSPLIVARQLDYTAKEHYPGYEKAGPLRKHIIKEILGIDIGSFNVSERITKQRVEVSDMGKIADLEGDVGIVSEIALRENRDLRAEDFDALLDKKTPGSHESLKRKDKALRYWQMVTKEMIGDYKKADDIYRALGFKGYIVDEHREQGTRMHDIDWDKIKTISLVGKRSKDDFIVKFAGWNKELLLNNHLIDRDWRYLLSTEDMYWEDLNIGALGERNPVRRVGDLGSHVQFAQLFEQFLTDEIVGTPDIKKMTDKMKEMVVAMAGDFIDIGWENGGRIAYTTGMMYRKSDWAWQIPVANIIGPMIADTAVIQMIRGRHRSESWGPNELLRYCHEVGGKEIIPAKQFSTVGGRLVGPNTEWYGQLLRERLGATYPRIFWEIGTLGPELLWLLTLFRALTAKDETEE